jgi:hypothetical protein
VILDADLEIWPAEAPSEMSAMASGCIVTQHDAHQQAGGVSQGPDQVKLRAIMHAGENKHMRAFLISQIEICTFWYTDLVSHGMMQTPRGRLCKAGF